MNTDTMSLRRAVLLVAEREIRAKLRDRTFLIGTAVAADEGVPLSG